MVTHTYTLYHGTDKVTTSVTVTDDIHIRTLSTVHVLPVVSLVHQLFCKPSVLMRNQSKVRVGRQFRLLVMIKFGQSLIISVEGSTVTCVSCWT